MDVPRPNVELVSVTHCQTHWQEHRCTFKMIAIHTPLQNDVTLIFMRVKVLLTASDRNEALCCFMQGTEVIHPLTKSQLLNEDDI